MLHFPIYSIYVVSCFSSEFVSINRNYLTSFLFGLYVSSKLIQGYVEISDSVFIRTVAHLVIIIFYRELDWYDFFWRSRSFPSSHLEILNIWNKKSHFFITIILIFLIFYLKNEYKMYFLSKSYVLILNLH